MKTNRTSGVGCAMVLAGLALMGWGAWMPAILQPFSRYDSPSFPLIGLGLLLVLLPGLVGLARDRHD